MVQLLIDLEEVNVPLPRAVQDLHGTTVETVATSGDGACAIHSVFGQWRDGCFAKKDARMFIRRTLSSTAGVFKEKLSSEALLQEMEMALWELIRNVLRECSANLAMYCIEQYAK